MNNFNKCQNAISILKSETEILMHELAPHDWAVFSQRVDELAVHLDSLIEEYSNAE